MIPLIHNHTRPLGGVEGWMLADDTVSGNGTVQIVDPRTSRVPGASIFVSGAPPAAHAGLAIGLLGQNGAVNNARTSQNSVGTSLTSRDSYDAQMRAMTAANTYTWTLIEPELIPGGVQGLKSQSGAFPLKRLIIPGVKSFTGVGNTGATQRHECGFRPTAMIFISSMDVYTQGYQTTAFLYVGFCDANLGQGYWGHTSVHAQATTHVQGLGNAGHCIGGAWANQMNFQGQVTDIDATGFTVTSTDNGANNYAWMALGDCEARVDIVSYAGTHLLPDFAFTPQAGIYVTKYGSEALGAVRVNSDPNQYLALGLAGRGDMVGNTPHQGVHRVRDVGGNATSNANNASGPGNIADLGHWSWGCAVDFLDGDRVQYRPTSAVPATTFSLHIG